MSEGCAFYADALVALADGTLEEERADGVRAHVAECADCQGELEVIRAVQRTPAPVPDGLEERLTAAVLGRAAGPDISVSTALEEVRGHTRGSKGWTRKAWRTRQRWASWGLPLAAAAAVGLWLGANQLLGPPSEGMGAAVELAEEWDPYGALPASDGMVAGEVVLSELSVEELERLLEEMQS